MIKKMIGRSRRHAKKMHSNVAATPPVELDCRFYADAYPDLTGKTQRQLIEHWLNHGKAERRIPSLKALAERLNRPLEAIKLDMVDRDFYLSLYPDLVKNGIKTHYQALVHYLEIGKTESRHPTYTDWLKHQKLPKSHFDQDWIRTLIQKAQAQLQDTKLADEQLTLSTFLQLLSGERILPIALSDSDQQTAQYYSELGQRHLELERVKSGLGLLKLSIHFAPMSKAHELLGNYFLDQKALKAAIEHYDQALALAPENFLALKNKLNGLTRLNQHSKALQTLRAHWINQSQHTLHQDQLDTITQAYYQATRACLDFYCDQDDKTQLVDVANQYAQTVYKTYLKTFGVDKPPALKALNTQRILIIGDYHVPQCVRYRIDQKAEQLETQNKTVNTLDWLALENPDAQTAKMLANHDVILFYRVPAVPAVLKAIAQTNATGKLAIYEIDDLLFDPVYPPPLSTYGGYVDLTVYQELTKGMSLFDAAARCCRVGLASTEPLAKHLKTRVFEHTCWVHRNGLDTLNFFQKPSVQSKSTVDIFYGSGTQAHNSDFIELALPALDQLLSEQSHVRLIIVGYLKLPDQFVQKHSAQLKQIPPVKQVQNYWQLLSQADINIAVLHPDAINDCKSELKWFEAACLGRPSVVSNTKNYLDVVKPDVDALVADSSETWYQCLKTLVDDPQKRQKIASAAQKQAQNAYSRESLGRQLTQNLHEYSQSHRPKRRKKIALVNVFFVPQSIGGATRVVEDNFDQLNLDPNYHYDLCVFTVDVQKRAPYRLSVYQHQGVNVYRTTSQHQPHQDWQAKDPKMYDLFAEFLQNEQPDLVHFHCIQRLTGSVVEATLDAKIPYVITAHDAWWISDYQFLVDEQGKVYPNGHPDLYDPLPLPSGITLDASLDRRQYLKKLLKKAQAVMTVSEAFAQIYRKNGIPRVQVTANGLSKKARWAPKQTQNTDKVICGHIGGMSEHKGYDLLKQAVLDTQPQHCELLIVDHRFESDYQHHETWGQVPVYFVGRHQQSHMPKLYQQIDVLFAPSIWPESYGLVTREAAASSCWVVASHLGGIGEDVIEGQTGHVIEPTLGALSNTLKKIDENPKKYKQRIVPQTLKTSDHQVQQIEEIYQKVLKPRTEKD